jgi:hypothetical protein
VDPGQPLLLDRVNTFIATVRKDGTLDRICDAYFAGGEPTPVISCPRDDSKDQLIVATNAMFALFEICKDPLPLPLGEVPQRGGEGKLHHRHPYKFRYNECIAKGVRRERPCVVPRQYRNPYASIVLEKVR